ncbi:hypothetical protein F2Q70_00016925 [Brassica cretica]|uniref:Uncharacterized protein n=1 Tax=Brassica cretica TaxID=69181 RepID=A0A8S9I6P8_BRACR|nr:hypothetical protein F2Q70_00016925 [Brassica cretica]
MEQAMAGQIQNQNQNQRQSQSNRQAVPAIENSQPDELKGLGLYRHQHQDGKTVMNPRVEHCNATELRCEKAKGKEPEQLSAETAPGAEERTEHPASSEVTAPDELAETPPVRVYVPKVPYPIPPRHLMDSISAEQLAGFRKMVRRLPQKISFEYAWEIRPLHMFFKHYRETREEIKALFIEKLTPSLKVLPKVDDLGKFSFPCSIAGVEFKEALCNSGSSVNLVSKAVVDELGIDDVECSLKLGDKSEIKEVWDGDPRTDTKKLSGNARVKEKVHKKKSAPAVPAAAALGWSAASVASIALRQRDHSDGRNHP